MANKPMSKLDSYALMIIAMSALFVSIWQVNQQQKHDRFSVMPYLDWITEKDGAGFTKIKVKNKGFGPAIFQGGYLALEDTTFRDWRKALNYLDPSIEINQSTIIGGAYTLLPGEEILLVTAKGGQNPIAFAYKVSFTNLYEDEYDDQYQHVGYPFR